MIDSEATAKRPLAARVPAPGPRRASLTRSRSLQRARLVGMAGQGNANALKHGVFATVANGAEVGTEVALIFATHPGLDPLLDRRFVELLATTNVQRQRAVIAMERDGMTAILTSYESRLAAQVERLEQRALVRERERLAVTTKATVTDLSAYAPPRRGSARTR